MFNKGLLHEKSEEIAASIEMLINKKEFSSISGKVSSNYLKKCKKNFFRSLRNRCFELMQLPEDVEGIEEEDLKNTNDFMDNNYWKCNDSKDEIDSLLMEIESSEVTKQQEKRPFILNQLNSISEDSPAIVNCEVDLYYDNIFWKTNIQHAQVDFSDDL